MSDFSVNVIGGRELQVKLGRMIAEGREILRVAVSQAQLDLASAAKRRLRGEVLHRRTGTLVSSITIDPIAESGGEMSGAVGTNEEYAEIQERGGTIRAKNVRNLTIPLAAMLTPRGIARGSARDVISNPGAFGLTGTFFAKGALMGTRGKGQVVPLFALRPSVTLPARPYMQPSLEEIEPRFESRLTMALERVLS